MYYFRNKVAHNSSFTTGEVEECKALCGDISEIIERAYEKLDTFKLSSSDQEAVVVAVKELGNDNSIESVYPDELYMISEEKLLDELECAQNVLPFVGLRYFVTDWLGKKGYDYEASFMLINYLEDKGVIKLSKIPNPAGGFEVTTISM